MKLHRTTKAFLLLCIFSTLTMVAACSGSGAPFGYDYESIDPPPEETTLTMSATNITLDEQGTEQSITVTSNTEWTVLPGFPGWLTITTASGNITVAATPNDEYTERHATLTVQTMNNEKSVTINVTQAAKQKGTPGDDDNTPPAYSRKKTE